MPSDPMKPEEAMVELNISRHTLLRLVKDGTLPVVRLNSRVFRFRAADVAILKATRCGG